MENENLKKITGNDIRKTFIEYFEEHGHTFVPSSSLVPGGDATLLFTNSGMVQFKDVFLGTDKRPYTRAANSQKSMRVAGKHNDLDDVGRDDTHHTFFEMLGNWSFGDYYKKEAIGWAWDLLTNVWGLPKDRLYATCFKDEHGQIPTDEEAADFWKAQPGMLAEHVLYFGRKDNFWEMAETGPCGPCSEIHIDRGMEFCDMQGTPHRCSVNGDCKRFLELWNLVFIQYNRTDPITFLPLPARHVDTGMGFERIVSVLQGKNSNYRTDLLWPLIVKTQELTGQSDEEVDTNFTPYRVIADHTRAASFLIADGVIPGNLGRNYVARMIIRRAYRFGGKIGLHSPFMAQVAEIVIANYGDAYPELARNQEIILKTITREEEQFQRTLDKATAQLEDLLANLKKNGQFMIPGDVAADLYTTHGMPLEITRDIAREQGLDVDEAGFKQAMESHRLASGAGLSMGSMGADDTELYTYLLGQLVEMGKISAQGVIYDPYSGLESTGEVLALIQNGQVVEEVMVGDAVEVLLPSTHFYIESGGQVSDTGTIQASDGRWEIMVKDVRRPAAGVIVHSGEVVSGNPKKGDPATAQVDKTRREDIIRNHTATHLLHAALHKVLGNHARQAGSLVAPDRLRFDFTHPQAVSPEELEAIEADVNANILGDFALNIQYKPLQQALKEGATALFGEKYGEVVRNITISDFSNELCGGTHVPTTGFIGSFMILTEGSAAAGIRRIEAVTGRAAYHAIQHRRKLLGQAARLLGTSLDQVVTKTQGLLDQLYEAHKESAQLRQALALVEMERMLDTAERVGDANVFTAILKDADGNTLRQMADRFRQQYPQNGVAVLGSVQDEKPLIVALVTDDLVKRGLHAGELVKHVAQWVGGGGGGKPNLAQAGGKDPAKLPEALQSVPEWVQKRLG